MLTIDYHTMADLLTGQMFCQVSVSDTTFTGRLDILILGLEIVNSNVRDLEIYHNNPGNPEKIFGERSYRL